MYPADTQRKIMYLLPTLHTSERTKMRIQKYEERGFTLHPFPFTFQAPDPLEDTAHLAPIQAFDVIQQEDIAAEHHVTRSRQHILVKAGDTFYAYDRTTLRDYLTAHEYSDGIMTVFDTPHKQSLTEEALTQFVLSDFTIFCLTQPTAYNDKTLYRVLCYTVKGWKWQAHGAIA